ncbi:MAG: hypothetical protein A2747_01640 [Candidatus Yonathbacteria bacterium RIFCSPHIGHO2_01_FULL_44_41]|uniref:Uncharacterized protein n=1 Tax=Candidatus Yonathbacteria bacterium RIFCSPHIGHO2_02_FULL_44_14 TaxID=1802724 RepID=A0A1G2S922_9BACT|nr:MAG: hypothetical protein A2747_01640 [Candidatus Yonathbacteria bacterium RIFCSPHIGHO2_01_FULL_44_41]OHA81566.1 MAG: hypothetical protein A3D51_02215 [Candidatus Yonathbacteria bacterium RIFCSPHIGHO2_02_FULL_44_14]OHA81747.1 MAG: hypothetical protein A3B06_02150 [Candidatus Yonathbacteria bacterium RIFCSPLOWO2_01_FULL_43_20]
MVFRSCFVSVVPVITVLILPAMRGVFKRVPFSETHTMDNFYAFHAEKHEGGGYCVRRKYQSDSYYYAPLGYFWGSPELITIMEENKFVYD